MTWDEIKLECLRIYVEHKMNQELSGFCCGSVCDFLVPTFEGLLKLHLDVNIDNQVNKYDI